MLASNEISLILKILLYDSERTLRVSYDSIPFRDLIRLLERYNCSTWLASVIDDMSVINLFAVRNVLFCKQFGLLLTYFQK
jgi:hypothetical protein